MTQVVATPGEGLGEVTITHEFAAPREMVFRAFMEPEQLVRFWAPTGSHVPIESVIIEPWPGGRFENDIVVDDDPATVYTFRSVFVEVREPERFVFREVDSGVLNESSFEDLDGRRTRVVIHQTNVPPMYRSKEALDGFMTTLVKLEAHLASLLERSDR